VVDSWAIPSRSKFGTGAGTTSWQDGEERLGQQVTEAALKPLSVRNANIAKAPFGNINTASSIKLTWKNKHDRGSWKLKRGA